MMSVIGPVQSPYREAV